MTEDLIALSDPKYDMAFTAAKIDFPAYDKLKDQVDLINSEYSQYAVTPNNFKAAKETRAQLNHLKQDLNKRKISIVKQANKPVNDFQAKFKVLLNEIGAASDHISEQIKVYEEHVRRDREEQNDRHITEWCKETGVDPNEIER
ncbi:DUF1351 domain-containing protein, partial [Lactobacillus sp. XV13L]|nr:DUF1351 domain-containing protein [Lactobacillus sp. XV13L]